MRLRAVRLQNMHESCFRFRGKLTSVHAACISFRFRKTVLPVRPKEMFCIVSRLSFLEPVGTIQKVFCLMLSLFPSSIGWPLYQSQILPIFYIIKTIHTCPTIELVVDHILQPLQPLENRLPVHQVGNFAIPGSQPLVRNTPYLDELLGSVLDPAVDREQDNPHKHQNVDGQQSFDFACHSHERRVLSGWLSQAQQLSVCGGLLLPPYCVFQESAFLLGGGEKVNS